MCISQEASGGTGDGHQLRSQRPAQAFRAVAELSNFRKAAEAVHVSQPAFSRRIDKLEQALGVRLLDRTTRRVSLTSVGRDFDRKVQQLAGRPRQHPAGHPRRRGNAHGRGDDRLRAVDRLLLPVAGDPRYHERLPEDPGQGVRCQRQRGADGGGPQRGRLRTQLHRRAGAGHRVQAAAGGALRRRLPARPSAREEAPVAWTELAQYDFISVARHRATGCCSTRRWPACRAGRRASTRRSTSRRSWAWSKPGSGSRRCPRSRCRAPTTRCWSALPLTDPVITRRVGLIRRKGRSLSPSAQQLYDFLAK